MSAVNETIASKPPSSSSTSLPDFGKTTIEVDKIKLQKKRRKKKKVSDYDTKVGMERNKNKNKKQNENKWRRSDLFGSSLVDQTIDDLKKDKDFQSTQKRIAKVGLEGISREERIQRRRALDKLNVKPFARFLTEQMNGPKPTTANDGNLASPTCDSGSSSTTAAATVAPKPKRIKPFVLKRKEPTVLQINIGLYCNQACGHCHVESSPLRKTEMMTAETAAQCLELLKNTPSIHTLDITGGAPELNQHFRYLVSTARAIRGKDLIIIDRCNLTVLQEPGQEDLVGFLKDHDVHVIASLPCYSAENVDTQRGGGVFERSIAALLALNEAGYGRIRTPADDFEGMPRLQLDLVYNPLGAFLPPPQEKLQVQYQKQLAENFGILFDQLYTITNMPIKRFADFLHRRGELAEYMDLLVRNFNPDTVQELMCLETINIGWDGRIYDCDFNQQLGYSIGVDSIHRGGKTVFDIESLNELRDVRIRTDNHCFGCTAGMGSS
jgi:radical SAM/Cys-rich protein